MSDVSIPKQCVVPTVGAIVFLLGYHRSMVVTDILKDIDDKAYAACVAWLDNEARPCQATYPLECLEEAEW
jgi:hypothetical protein